MNQQLSPASTQFRPALQFSAKTSILAKGTNCSILRREVAKEAKTDSIFARQLTRRMSVGDAERAAQAGAVAQTVCQRNREASACDPGGCPPERDQAGCAESARPASLATTLSPRASTASARMRPKPDEQPVIS